MKDKDDQFDLWADPNRQVYPSAGWSDPYEPDAGPEDEKEK